MTDSHTLREKNRRTGIFLLVIFLGLAVLAVMFVILRKCGYA